MTFAKRIINLHFQLGQGDFGQAGQDVISFSGLRCSADITKVGSGLTNADLSLRVWGLPLDAMNKLTVLNRLVYAEQRFNSVLVEAGDSDTGQTVCFAGNIQEAWADASDPPNVMFSVHAVTGMVDMVKPAPPTSYKGDVDVTIALADIAKQMGLTLESHSVTAKLHNPYWPGSLGAQLRAICADADIQFFIDDTTKVLAIWPNRGSRGGDAIVISAKTGMVGYPSFTQGGMQVRTIFNPNLTFGRLIELQNETFSAANGTWVVAAASHNLDCDIPGGHWFTEVECTLLGHEVGIIG